MNEAAEIIAEAADPEAVIIFGAVIDETLQDEIRVTVIATGFSGSGDGAGQSGHSSGPCGRLDIKPFATDDLEIPAFLRRRS